MVDKKPETDVDKSSKDTKAADVVDKCNLKPSKNCPSFRQLIPILICILTFATVLSVLIVYMDTTGVYLITIYYDPQVY